jgi:hypothetical protein
MAVFAEESQSAPNHGECFVLTFNLELGQTRSLCLNGRLIPQKDRVGVSTTLNMSRPKESAHLIVKHPDQGSRGLRLIFDEGCAMISTEAEHAPVVCSEAGWAWPYRNLAAFLRVKMVHHACEATLSRRSGQVFGSGPPRT